MILPSVGLIGGGRVTRILLGGWRHAGLRPSRIVVSDVDANARQGLHALHPEVEVTADNHRSAAQDVVFLAIHPPVVPAVLDDIRTIVTTRTLIVYLGSKVTLARLQEGLGGHTALARIIPNAPSIIGEGYNPTAMHEHLKSEHRESLASLFAPLGAFPEVAEPKLEAYVLLTGMGPTYLWFQLQEIRELAASFGLTDTEILPALECMVTGAARTLLSSGLSPEATMDLVPVKPLAEEVPAIRAAYRARLPAMFAKIRP